MRTKEEILSDYCNAGIEESTEVQYRDSMFQEGLLELLADIRDEQVSLNKTLSAVLAGLLVPAQQGTPDYTTDTR